MFWVLNLVRIGVGIEIKKGASAPFLESEDI